MKWTKKEDEELCSLVDKYGPAWQEIQSKFSTGRSRNALIKRWHGKLKEDVQEGSNPSPSESDQAEPEGRMPTRASGNSKRQPEPKQPKKKLQPPQPPSTPTPQPQTYSKPWSFKDDEDLKDSVLKHQQYDWNNLCRQFGAPRQEVIRRWQKIIYPQIKLNDKVAGAVKWSKQQDDILINCEKIHREGWEKILVFLPARSVFSIQARLKRIYAKQTVENPSALGQKPKQVVSGSGEPPLSKYEYRKQIIRKIAEQRGRMQLENGNGNVGVK